MDTVGNAESQEISPKLSRLWDHAIKYLPSSLVPALTAVAATAVFTRLLNPGQYGLYSLALAVVVPATTVFGQLTGNGTGRYYQEYVRRGQLEAYREAVSWLIYLTVALIVLLTLGAVGVFWTQGPGRSLLWTVLGVGALVMVQSVTTIVTPILSAKFLPTTYSVSLSSSALLSFGIEWGLLALFGVHAYWLLWGAAIGQLLLLPYLFRYFPLVGLARVWPLSADAKHAIRQFLGFGIPTAFWVLSASLMGTADRFLLATFRGEAAVGVYSINVSIAGQAMGLAAGPMIAASWPLLMDRFHREGTAAAQSALAYATRMFLLVTFGIVGLLAVVGSAVEDLFLGAGFTQGAYLLLPLLVATAFWAAGRLGHGALKLTARNWLLVADALVAGLANVILNLGLIPRWGMLGAAVSLMAGFFLYTALVWWQSRQIMPWRVDFLLLGQVVLLAVLSGVLADHIDGLLAPAPKEVLILAGMVSFGVVYSAGAWALWKRSLRLVGGLGHAASGAERKG
ncbi:MAG: polysaccharide biosynthesis C-terminal domain-containing protein [Firmicutes bacterium]|nr:polysaccharide biosynthesis C-terminal domain-containing protein [Bacillota bacterium]